MLTQEPPFTPFIVWHSDLPGSVLSVCNSFPNLPCLPDEGEIRAKSPQH